jgi:hypothetical protein
MRKNPRNEDFFPGYLLSGMEGLKAWVGFWRVLEKSRGVGTPKNRGRPDFGR